MKIFYSENHKLHDPASLIVDGRPFESEDSPARIQVILDALRTSGLGTIAPAHDFGLEPILKVHDPDYIHFLQTIHSRLSNLAGAKVPVIPETFAPRQARRRPRGFYGLPGYYAFGVGSPILEGTWTAAYWSAQCALSAALRVLQGDRASYALCRPPGHHAGEDFYGGFCYLNNAAIAARFLNRRLAILDIDFHHGNGTQEIFYQDPSVLYCSLHADPDLDYPYYWGEAGEKGAGPGEGFNHNWPLPLGAGDNLYLSTLAEALLVIRQFQPQALIVSAGLDIVPGDPAGGFRVTESGLREIGRRIFALGLPTVVLQEGGYLLETLGQNALAFLSAFAA